MASDRRVPADSVAGRRRLVQPLGGIVFLVGALVLLAFTPRVHRMLTALGWFVIAGSVVASVAHDVAGAYFLASAVTVPVPVKDDILSALYDAVLSAPVLAGRAVLTLGRIMKAGAHMRDDLEGTV